MAYRSKGFLGDTNIGVFKLGDSDVKLYLGDMLVYPLSQGIFNIMCDSATYDGTLQVAQNIVVTDESGNTLIENVDYTVTENNGGTNAGSYPIIITLMGQYQGTASGEFVIDKADSLLSFAISDMGVRTGGTKSNPARTIAGDGAISYTSNDASVVTVDNSGNVTGVTTGDTTIIANIEGTQNYNSASTRYNVTAYDANWHVTAKINVTDTTNPTKIASAWQLIRLLEIDGVVQSRVVSDYTFDTVGEHIVKYCLQFEASTHYAYVVNCFGGCHNITEIVISDTEIEAIANGGFRENSGITRCIIGDSVTNIEDNAFYKCYNLESITIPDSVTNIGESAFAHCSGLTSVIIGSGVTYIDQQAFRDCYSLESITIPDSVTSIDTSVFCYCSGITSVTIGSGLTNIEEGTFMCCYGLTSIGPIGSGASVEIPDNVTSIGYGAFEYCSGLTNITIPDSVTSIDKYAFYRCSGLTSVTIGSGVTFIGTDAFDWCTSLISVTVNAVTPPTLRCSFYKTNYCPIYVPAESVEAYKTAGDWSSLASRIQAIP